MLRSGLARGYVLAGGVSSRMGRDKALVELGGRTLLERAAAVLGEVCGEVAAVGEPRGAAAVRWVRDRVPGCGPVSGLDAALADARAAGVAWVVMLPVDVPLVPAGLVEALAARWTGAERCRAGFPVVDGIPQPAVAAVHVDLLAGVAEALARGELKLRPLLERLTADLAGERGWAAAEVLRVERLRLEGAEAIELGWELGAAEWARRGMWFANVNTPEELRRVEGLVGGQ